MKEVKSLVAVIEEIGNPFLEQSQDLLFLDTGDILDPSVGESVRKAEKLGEKQYHNFVEERLVKCEKSILDVIPKTSWYCSVTRHQSPPQSKNGRYGFKKMTIISFRDSIFHVKQDRMIYRPFSCMRTRLLRHRCHWEEKFKADLLDCLGLEE